MHEGILALLSSKTLCAERSAELCARCGSWDHLDLRNIRFGDGFCELDNSFWGS